jgi:transcriptional regulator with XRE-family HTH domain
VSVPRDAGSVVQRSNEIEARWAAYAQRLATSLRRARTQAGLSQEDVAYRVGLTRYTYQKYEKGESRPGRAANPSLRTMLAVAQVLNVSLTDLIPPDPPDLHVR